MQAMASKHDELDDAIRAIRQIMNMFVIERILCVICGICSFGLFLFAAYKLFDSQTVDTKTMGIIFGASGISTAASAGISYYLNKSFNIIERLILGVATEPAPPAPAPAPPHAATA
jgi:hypothetical protein